MQKNLYVKLHADKHLNLAKLHAGHGGLGKARLDVSIFILTHPAAGVAQFPTKALAIRSSEVSQSAFLDMASQSLSINQWHKQ